MGLFSKWQYTVEQKRLPIGEDVYEIKDLDKNLICYVKREKHVAEHVGKYLLGLGDELAKHTLAAELWFESPDGQKLLTLSKGKGYKNIGFELRDPEGNVLGSVQMKKRIIGKPRYVLEDSEGNELAEVKSGLVVRHNFKIKTPKGKEVGKVHQKWLKVMKDAYEVDISDQTFDQALILSLVVAIDVIEN